MLKHEKARIRNWSKARIMGISFNMDGIAPSEVDTVIKIRKLRDELMFNWDKNSEFELGMKVKKK